VIAISTYTEPVLVNPVVNEPLQSKETEEEEESGEFAEILAGLLRTNETIQTDQSVKLSEFEPVFTVQLAEEAESVEETDLFEIAGIAQDINIDFSGIEIPEYTNDLSGIENFEQVIEAVTDDIVPVVSDVKTETLAELKIKNEKLDFAQSVYVSPDLENAALEVPVKDTEDILSDDAAGKKEKFFTERSLSGNEKTEAFAQNLKSSNETDVLRKTSDNESRGRLDEIRNRSRREMRSVNGVAIEVRDFRTAEAGGLNISQKPFSALEASVGRAQSETPVREITLELRLPEQNNSAPQTTWEAKASTALENMLARELHQNFNGDIVRHASMALRDGGEGTIRIALKPESLGNVKIRLEMSENKITGIIFVESEESLNAFRREITSLEQAFRDSGFTNADLNLTLTQDGQSQQEWKREANSFTSQIAASRYEESFDDAPLVNVFIGRQQGSINMLA